MKSVNVEAKNVGKLNRIGTFSFLALMILTLSSGRVLGEKEKVTSKPETLFEKKVCHTVEGKDTPVALQSFDDKDQPIKKEDNEKRAVKWLSSEKPNFKLFVDTWSSEPRLFVEGMKAALLSVLGDESELTDKQKTKLEDIRKGLKEAIAKKFENKDNSEESIEGFNRLIDMMIDSTPREFLESTKGDFLSVLHDVKVMELLALNNEKDCDKEKGDPGDEDPKPPRPPVTPPAPPVAPPAAPVTPPPAPTTGDTGELEALKALLEGTVCPQLRDSLAAQERQAQALEDLKKQAADQLAAMNDFLTKAGQQQPQVAKNEKKNNNELADALAAQQLQDALNKLNEQEENLDNAFANRQPPQIPQDNNKDDNTESAANTPTPPATQEQPEPPQPVASVPASIREGELPPAGVYSSYSSDLGTRKSNVENMTLDAENYGKSIDKLSSDMMGKEMEYQQMINRGYGQFVQATAWDSVKQLLTKQSELKNKISEYQTAAKNAKTKAAEAKEQAELVKQNAMASLTPVEKAWVEGEKADLEKSRKNLEERLTQVKAQAAQAGEEGAQAFAGALASAENDIKRQKDAESDYQKKINKLVQDKSGTYQQDLKKASDLEEVASTLASKASSLSDKDSTLQSAIDTQKKYAMGFLNNPVATGTKNAFQGRLQQPLAGGTRQLPSSLGAAAGATPAKGGVQRPSLLGK